jgi:hypothetical protein
MIAMIKKLMIGLAPLLVVAAFAVMPAMASAATLEYGTCGTPGTTTSPPCGTGEHFTAFGNATHKVSVTSKKSGTAPFVLVDEVTGEAITCTTFSDTGKLWNEGGKGHSEDKLVFDDCTINANGCHVASTETGENIEGSVTNIVLKENAKKEYEVEIKVVAPGFNIETTGLPAGCPKGVEVGKVTGTAIGEQGLSSSVLTFTNATGLKLNTDASNITGADETLDGTKPVFIN